MVYPCRAATKNRRQKKRSQKQFKFHFTHLQNDICRFPTQERRVRFRNEQLFTFNLLLTADGYINCRCRVHRDVNLPVEPIACAICAPQNLTTLVRSQLQDCRTGRRKLNFDWELQFRGVCGNSLPFSIPSAVIRNFGATKSHPCFTRNIPSWGS